MPRPGSGSTDSSNGNNDLIYGVSLVIHSRSTIADREDNEDYTIQLSESKTKETPVVSYSYARNGGALVDENSLDITLRVNEKAIVFQRRLNERRCSNLNRGEVAGENGEFTVGIALVARRNSIPAMRETLTRLFEDFTSVAPSLPDDGVVSDSQVL